LIFLSEIGFVPYTGQNLWIKYISEDNSRKPFLYATVLRSGKIVISNTSGNVIITSAKKEEIFEKLRILFLDIILK
jgi:hypothetical protein